MITRQSDSGVKIIDIDTTSVGQRVDNFLIKVLKGVPKSRIYRCLRKGEVRLNGKRVKASTRLSLADKVRIPPLRCSGVVIHVASNAWLARLANTIIYEDKNLLVVNKPVGMAVHGGSGISLGVIEGIRQLRSQDPYLALVHRLDKETSGCLMIAKKPSYLKELQRSLNTKSGSRQHYLGKHYIAVVHGRWPQRKQHVDLPLRKNSLASGERVSIVSPEGKASRTEFAVLDANDIQSLLVVKPITGRTHQIRVHCQYLGFPILGDPKYGAEHKDEDPYKLGRPGRMMLHAHRLEIPALGGNAAIKVSAKFDNEMEEVIKCFSKNISINSLLKVV